MVIKDTYHIVIHGDRDDVNSKIHEADKLRSTLDCDGYIDGYNKALKAFTIIHNEYSQFNVQLIKAKRF